MSTPQKINNRFQIELESKYGRFDVFDRANNKKKNILQTFCNNVNSMFSKKDTKLEKTCRKVVSSKWVYYLILELLGQR
jgi:hypothetical protein